MAKLFLFVLALVSLLVMGTGCKTHSGSKQFEPGKGWVPAD